MKALTPEEMIMVKGGDDLSELGCFVYLIEAGVVTAFAGAALGPFAAIAAGSFLLGASPC